MHTSTLSSSYSLHELNLLKMLSKIFYVQYNRSMKLIAQKHITGHFVFSPSEPTDVLNFKVTKI